MTFYRSRLPVLGRKRLEKLGVLSESNTEHIEDNEETQDE